MLVLTPSLLASGAATEITRVAQGGGQTSAFTPPVQALRHLGSRNGEINQLGTMPRSGLLLVCKK